MKVVKVLRYMNGRTADGLPQTQMEVLAEETAVLGGVNYDKTKLVDLLSTVEEPTAAQLVALTDSYLALGDKDKAAQAAKTAITLSGGDRVTLLTLTTILLRADMVQLAKKAFVAIDEGLLSKIDEFTLDERAEKLAKVEKLASTGIFGMLKSKVSKSK